MAAQFRLRVVGADGEPTAPPFGPFTAAEDGTVNETLPASATAAVKPGRATNWRETVRIELLGAGFQDDGPLGSGFWAAPDGEPAGSAAVTAVPDEPVLENSFVSSKGWVKPGETYPFTVRVRNYTDAPFTNLTVAVSVPDGTTLIGELRHRPRPRPPRLVHRRPEGHRGRHGPLRVGLRDRHRHGDLQRRLP